MEWVFHWKLLAVCHFSIDKMKIDDAQVIEKWSSVKMRICSIRRFRRRRCKLFFFLLQWKTMTFRYMCLCMDLRVGWWVCVRVCCWLISILATANHLQTHVFRRLVNLTMSMRSCVCNKKLFSKTYRSIVVDDTISISAELIECC